MHGTNAPEAYMTGRMLIDGELVESKDGAWLESINPADESPLGRVPMGSVADMAAAVEAAEKAQPAWAALSMAQRAAFIHKLGDAILAPGVVNIVTGARETGEALVRHPRVKRIAFIGQPASGMAIQKAAAETAVKHVTLELGGKNPLIAFEDSDLDKVAACAVGGMNFGWQGQSCGSMSRILLQESIHDRVVERIPQLLLHIQLS